jgi:hypothetical protein
MDAEQIFHALQQTRVTSSSQVQPERRGETQQPNAGPNSRNIVLDVPVNGSGSLSSSVISAAITGEGSDLGNILHLQTSTFSSPRVPSHDPPSAEIVVPSSPVLSTSGLLDHSTHDWVAEFQASQLHEGQRLRALQRPSRVPDGSSSRASDSVSISLLDTDTTASMSLPPTEPGYESERESLSPQSGVVRPDLMCSSKQTWRVPRLLIAT